MTTLNEIQLRRIKGNAEIVESDVMDQEEMYCQSQMNSCGIRADAMFNEDRWRECNSRSCCGGSESQSMGHDPEHMAVTHLPETKDTCN